MQPARQIGAGGKVDGLQLAAFSTWPPGGAPWQTRPRRTLTGAVAYKYLYCQHWALSYLLEWKFLIGVPLQSCYLATLPIELVSFRGSGEALGKEKAGAALIICPVHVVGLRIIADRAQQDFHLSTTNSFWEGSGGGPTAPLDTI